MRGPLHFRALARLAASSAGVIRGDLRSEVSLDLYSPSGLRVANLGIITSDSILHKWLIVKHFLLLLLLCVSL